MTLQPTHSTSVRAPPHQVSCVLCRQRKVKCDKQQRRCSNCVKAGVECVYVTPARPRHRIGNGKSPEDVSREELIRRVRRYEALFRKHGLQFEASDRDSAGGENPTQESHPATSAAVVTDQMLTQQ
jgi:Fungal Zn(2)-Cys(6) binuclear cluster domain